MLEGRKHTHSHTGPPPVHILCAWRVKICKAPPSSKQKLQGNIGQLSELKCIPGDMFFFLYPGSLPLISPPFSLENQASLCNLVQITHASSGQMLVQVMITWTNICGYLEFENWKQWRLNFHYTANFITELLTNTLTELLVQPRTYNMQTVVQQESSVKAKITKFGW